MMIAYLRDEVTHLAERNLSFECLDEMNYVDVLAALELLSG
jgi:hypothetical protein